jgi:hypothetical protein
MLTLEVLKRSLPEFTLSHSTLLMALSEVEGLVEGVEMTTYLSDTTLARKCDSARYMPTGEE